MPSYVPGYDTEGLLPYVIWGVGQDRPLPEVLMGSPAEFPAIDGPLKQKRAATQAWEGIG